VNRTTRWLLPTVLVLLVVGALVGAVHWPAGPSPPVPG